jgi:hypothetical protein
VLALSVSEVGGALGMQPTCITPQTQGTNDPSTSIMMSSELYIFIGMLVR